MPGSGTLVSAEGRLVALLDFQDTCTADPALDLAAQIYLEPPSSDATIEAYVERTGTHQDLAERIRCYALVRELGGLAYSVRNDLPGEIDHATKDLLDLLG
jgi:hypothetical protein